MSGGFERIPRPEQRLLRRGEPDPSGRGALFTGGASRAPRQPPPALAVHCARCGATSPLDAATAVRSALPLFLVAPWRDHPVFAVCPAGRHRAWLRVQRAP